MCDINFTVMAFICNQTWVSNLRSITRSKVSSGLLCCSDMQTSQSIVLLSATGAQFAYRHDRSLRKSKGKYHFARDVRLFKGLIFAVTEINSVTPGLHSRIVAIRRWAKGSGQGDYDLD